MLTGHSRWPARPWEWGGAVLRTTGSEEDQRAALAGAA